MELGYLKLDSTRVSFAEYWRWKPNVQFAILATWKLIRWRMPPNVLVPATAMLEVVDPAAQPAELVAALAEPIKECEARARALTFWYTVPTLGPSQGLAAALVGSDSRSVAMAAVSQTTDGLHREVTLGLASRLRTGGFLATGLGKSLFDPPPEVESLALRGRTYAEVLETHDKVVSGRGAQVIPCGDARELILELQRLQVRANVTRGLYVPASPAEVVAMSQLARGRRTRS